MSKKVKISIISVLALAIISGGLYYYWLNLVHNARYSGKIACGWQDLFEGDCGPDVNDNYPIITEKEVKRIINGNYGYKSKEETVKFIDEEIVRMEQWLKKIQQKDELSEINNSTIVTQRSKLLRLKTAKEILLKME